MADLEAAGIGIIQIDEPALREGLPLRRSDWDAYLQWGVEAFRINAAVAKDDTQIHTHMCYSQFNDIMDSIAALGRRRHHHRNLAFRHGVAGVV